MSTSREERIVKITVTPDGAPAVCESGGLLNFEGKTVIVANPTGGKPYAEELRSEICGVHAVVKVDVGYYVIVATVRRRLIESIRIEKIVGVSVEGESATAQVQVRARYTINGWDYPAVAERLADAVAATREKAMVHHCRSAMYVTPRSGREAIDGRAITAPVKSAVTPIKVAKAERPATSVKKAERLAAKQDANDERETSLAAKLVLEPRLKELRAQLAGLRRRHPQAPRITFYSTQFCLDGTLTGAFYTEENVRVVEQIVVQWSQKEAARAAAEWEVRVKLKDRLKELMPRLTVLRRNDRSVPMIRLWTERFGFGDVLRSVLYTDENVRIVEQWVEGREAAAD